ncbi:hypothetical protein FRC17_007325 [Serendipita sp. 399]|nr:hypothetical protein FRC17_007325 [Serendipita sp. 399]
MQKLVQGIKSIPAKLSPKSPSIRRAAQFFTRSPNSSPESERPVISQPIPKPEPLVLRFSYDWMTRRLTGLENWHEIYPTSNVDPFQNVEIFDPALPMGNPHNEPELRQPIVDKIRQKLGEVIAITTHKLPASFRLEVMTSEPAALDTSNVEISPPFNVTHTLAVTSDPRTGRLEGLPSAWRGEGTSGTTPRTVSTKSLIVSDVISLASLSRYMRPALPPRPSLNQPASSLPPLVMDATDAPLASAPIILSTPVPRDPSTQQQQSAKNKKEIARKPVPPLGPGFPEASTRPAHRRNPTSNGVSSSTTSLPIRPRGVTVSGVPGEAARVPANLLSKPLPALPTE